MTCWPFWRHFSGFGSSFLHLRYATFSFRHLISMCFDADISTADVGIGFPTASTALDIFPIGKTSHELSVHSLVFRLVAHTFLLLKLGLISWAAWGLVIWLSGLRVYFGLNNTYLTSSRPNYLSFREFFKLLFVLDFNAQIHVFEAFRYIYYGHMKSKISSI